MLKKEQNYKVKFYNKNFCRLTARSRDSAETAINFYLAELENMKSSPYELHTRLKPRALVVDGKTLTFILDLR